VPTRLEQVIGPDSHGRAGQTVTADGHCNYSNSDSGRDDGLIRILSQQTLERRQVIWLQVAEETASYVLARVAWIFIAHLESYHPGPALDMKCDFHEYRFIYSGCKPRIC
jgi:hypothetical protein